MKHNLSDDPFDLLAQVEVPEIPTEFNEKFHQRLNEALVSTHLLEFVWHALPAALATFLGAIGFWMSYTATGRLNNNTDRSSEKP